MRRYILLAIVFIFSIHANGEWKISMWTSKPSYGYGETIEVAIRIANAGTLPDTLRSSTTCIAWLRPDTVTYGMACGYEDVRIPFNPGDARTWFWHLIPARFAYPTFGGLHRVWGVCAAAGLLDSVEFEAPEFRGGELLVNFKPETPQSAVDSICSSINATVVSQFRDSSAVHDDWIELGFSTDSLATALLRDSRVTLTHVERSLMPDSIALTWAPPEARARFAFELKQNYPNPFNPTTTINYTLPSTVHVVVAVFNMLGEEVDHLIDEVQHQGIHTLEYNASRLASGTYFLRVSAGTYVATKKIVLLK